MAAPPDENAQPTAAGGGAAAARPARELIGTTLSERYLIERLIGEGGMGAVYEAQHTLMKKRMAIKVLHPEMTRLPEVVARFEREALAAAHIEHPHVVTATDFGKLDDGSFFLALEYVEGKSLREVIAQGRVELGRALHIARQIASALSRAHALKIVHRDLKPENVMLIERDGDPDFVKVLDFGIAKVQIGELTAGDVEQAQRPGQQVLTQAGMVYGTPEYMAPEQALGQNVDARADLYALGVIMFEMLAGARPFEADSKVALLGMHVTAPVPKFDAKAREANVPPEVEALIGKMLEKESAVRLGDARELVGNITAILEQLVVAGRIDPAYAPAPTSGIITSPGFVGGISATTEEKTEPLLAGRAWLVAAGGGLLGLVVLVTTIIYILASRDPRTTTMDGAEAGTTTTGIIQSEPSVDAKVKDAIAKIDSGDYASGIKTIDDLGEEVQGREDVHRALFKAYGQTDRPKEAMREVANILKAKPDIDVGKETNLRVAVRDTGLREGMKDKAAVDAAYDLLTGPMGKVGWDDLYDIAYGTSGQNYPKAAARAKAELARGDRTKMSPSLGVTVDLHVASERNNCPALKGLLDDAVANGDIRTLALLKQLTIPRMVGHWRKTDVLWCIHTDRSADKAAADLGARLKK
jgi:serine/threonine-protein kinase